MALPCIWNWRNDWETELQVGKFFGPLVKISKLVQVQLRWPQKRLDKILLSKL